MRHRRGVTLIELVVALAIVGITTSIVLLAWRQPADSDESTHSFTTLVSDARRTAIASGRARHVRFRLIEDGAVVDAADVSRGGVVRHLVANPDGSVVADTSLRVDRLAGHVAPVRVTAP